MSLDARDGLVDAAPELERVLERLVAVLDNLGKGAAGQALQNANIISGFSETAGLSTNGVAP